MNRSVLLFLSALLISILFVFGYLLVNLARPPEPPLHYTAMEYPAEKAVYLPGELIHFTPTLVLRYGGEVEGLRTFYDITRGRTARLCSGGPSPKYPLSGNLARGVYGNIFQGGLNVPLPTPPMPPGRYKIITNLHGFGAQSGETGYDVEFSIEKPC